MSVGESVANWLPRPVMDRINAIPLGRRLARGAFWTLVGAGAARVLRIPVSVVLARFMGPTEYGKLGIVSASLELFGVFASLGLGLTATKYVAELRVKDPSRAGRIIAVSMSLATIAGAVFALSLFALAPWLAARALAAPQLVNALRVGSVALFFSAINGAQAGALYGFEAFKITARLQTIVGLLDVLFMVGGYFLAGLNGVVGGIAASRCAEWLLRRRAIVSETAYHGIDITLRDWKREMPLFWRFSLPALLASLMVTPVNWLCSAMLVNRSNGYAEMGLYSAANQWYGALLFLPTVLGSSLLPIFSERFGAKDHKASGNILNFMVLLNAGILIPLVIGMSLFSPYIMRMYGVGYGSAWPTLIVILITAALLGVLTPVGDIITASGRMWLGLAMNAGWALVYIVSTVFLVRSGSIGLASSRLIAYGVHAIWTVVFARSFIRQSDKQHTQLASVT